MYLCSRVQFLIHFFFHGIAAPCLLSSTDCLNYHAKILKTVLKEQQTIRPPVKRLHIYRTEFTPHIPEEKLT